MSQIVVVLSEQAQAYVNEQLALGGYSDVSELVIGLIMAEQKRQVQDTESQDKGSYVALEQRVALLESQLLKVLRKQDLDAESNWIERLTGSISNEALFLEALAEGRSLRVDDQPVGKAA